MNLNSINDNENRYTLNPFFRLRFFEGGASCDLLLEGKSLQLDDPLYPKLLADISEIEKSRSVRGQTGVPRAVVIGLASNALQCSQEDAEKVCDDLIANGLLVKSEEADSGYIEGVRHWINRGWLDALVLHLSTRDLKYADDGAATPDEIAARMIEDAIRKDGYPEIWKRYPGSVRVELPEVSPLPPEKTFDEVLLSRRSNKPFRRGTIPLNELSATLAHANRETVTIRKAIELEAHKSPQLFLNSAFTAIESYVVVFDVESLVPGLYHYCPELHVLSLVRPGIFRREVMQICIGQDRPGKASCAFLLSVVWSRYMFRYRHGRAYRTLLTNVAEMAQKLILLATFFDQSTFLTPALKDELAADFLEVDGFKESPLYLVAVG